MINFRLMFLLVSIPASLSAKTISTPDKAIVLGGDDIGKRVCYYQDKAYSEGAVLQIGEHYIICDKANSFETNGSLKWHQLKGDIEKKQ
ncbi:DUF1496 domain-containing protein [Vibrio hannami]|uniref:DUF1496 domain-containing protein n=1 Tax=Vibrio hannami TaxID=2717094 RepID=UPI0024109BE0|nr:DUF1496 domain-containing protein [Vibrio hannami]MDG3085997.1 DUF1496 domain-containing protein [Vibrio hannami]